MATAFGEAWTQTFRGEPVRIAGHVDAFPALFLEPERAGIRVTGFRAETIGQLFGHARAWMGGDFREGPQTDLGEFPAVLVEAGAGTIGAMYDGEQEDAAVPARFVHDRSSVRFIRTVPPRPGRVPAA
jgi:hypothetical protein